MRPPQQIQLEPSIVNKFLILEVATQAFFKVFLEGANKKLKMVDFAKFWHEQQGSWFLECDPTIGWQ